MRALFLFLAFIFLFQPITSVAQTFKCTSSEIGVESWKITLKDNAIEVIEDLPTADRFAESFEIILDKDNWIVGTRRYASPQYRKDWEQLKNYDHGAMLNFKFFFYEIASFNRSTLELVYRVVPIISGKGSEFTIQNRTCTQIK